MLFAFLMGSARAFYGKSQAPETIPTTVGPPAHPTSPANASNANMALDEFMIGSSVLCIISYLCISLVPSPIVGFIGCALCGLSVSYGGKAFPIKDPAAKSPTFGSKSLLLTVSSLRESPPSAFVLPLISVSF